MGNNGLVYKNATQSPLINFVAELRVGLHGLFFLVVMAGLVVGLIDDDGGIKWQSLSYFTTLTNVAVCAWFGLRLARDCFAYHQFSEARKYLAGFPLVEVTASAAATRGSSEGEEAEAEAAACSSTTPLNIASAGAGGVAATTAVVQSEDGDALAHRSVSLILEEQMEFQPLEGGSASGGARVSVLPAFVESDPRRASHRDELSVFLTRDERMDDSSAASGGRKSISHTRNRISQVRAVGPMVGMPDIYAKFFDERSPWLEAVRLAILVSITLTGVVWWLLIRPHVEAAKLASIRYFVVTHIHHTWTPLVFCLDWLFYNRHGLTRWSHLGAPLLPPLVYLGASLIRGSFGAPLFTAKDGRPRYHRYEFMESTGRLKVVRPLHALLRAHDLGSLAINIALLFCLVLALSSFAILADHAMARHGLFSWKTTTAFFTGRPIYL